MGRKTPYSDIVEELNGKSLSWNITEEQYASMTMSNKCEFTCTIHSYTFTAGIGLVFKDKKKCDMCVKGEQDQEMKKYRKEAREAIELMKQYIKNSKYDNGFTRRRLFMAEKHYYKLTRTKTPKGAKTELDTILTFLEALKQEMKDIDDYETKHSRDKKSSGFGSSSKPSSDGTWWSDGGNPYSFKSAIPKQPTYNMNDPDDFDKAVYAEFKNKSLYYAISRIGKFIKNDDINEIIKTMVDTPDSAQRTYRRLMRILHPDKLAVIEESERYKYTAVATALNSVK